MKQILDAGAAIGDLWNLWLPVLALFWIAKRVWSWWPNRRLDLSGGVLRRYRIPLLQPVFERDRQRGQVLVDLVRQTGLVPLKGRPHPSRLRTLDRWLKRNLFMLDIDPKPAFAIKSWRFDLARDPDSPVFFEHSVGFTLQVELEEGESRSHLLHSLKNGRRGNKRIGKRTAPRLVAIAPVEALADPTMWVRCLAVDASAAVMPNAQQSMIDVPSDYEGGSVFRARQKDVPDHALWLFCRGQGQTQPGPDWGHSSDHFAADPADFPHPPEEHQEHLDRARQRDRQWQRRQWLTIGLGLPLKTLPFLAIAVGCIAYVSWVYDSPELFWKWLVPIAEVLARIWGYSLGIWLTAVITAGMQWFFGRAESRLTSSQWRDQDSRDNTAPWPGATPECLLLTHLYHSTPTPDPQQPPPAAGIFPWYS